MRWTQGHRSASDKARVVLCGNDAQAMCLARDLYDELTKPLILRLEQRAKCKLVSAYVTSAAELKAFQCCLIHTLLDVNAIKVYAPGDVRSAVHNAVAAFQQRLVSKAMKVSPSTIRQLRRQGTLDEFEALGVYVELSMESKAAEIVYCRFGDEARIKQKAECAANIETLIQLREDARAEEAEKKDEDEAKVCGVCFMEIESDEKSLKLRLCAHEFHADCIAMQFNSANAPSGTRPIRCAKCAALVSLLDVRDVISSAEKYRQLLSFCVNAFVDSHPNEFRHCPTADCKQVYAVSNGKQAEQKEQKEDGAIFSCTECMRQYCLACEVDYHFGMSCAGYRLSKDADQSLQKFLEQYKSDSATQKCPSCGMITDKLKHTCNHATCVYCKAHFCWKCLWMHPDDNKDGGKVYRHMTTKHGGFYG